MDITPEMAPEHICACHPVAAPRPNGQRLCPYGSTGCPHPGGRPALPFEPVMTCRCIEPGVKGGSKFLKKGHRNMSYPGSGDEGLLDLTRFGLAPDAWQRFLCQGGAGRKTWDLYDQVAGFGEDRAAAGHWRGWGNDTRRVKAAEPGLNPWCIFLTRPHWKEKANEHRVCHATVWVRWMHHACMGYYGAYGKTDKNDTCAGNR